MTIIEAINTRKSCRTYGEDPVSPGKIAELKVFLAANHQTPFGSVVRFQLLDFHEMGSGELKNLTTYGVIKGARHFIAGAVTRQAKAMEDYGYCMEKNVLQATSLGLGTCLLGGTFKRSGFAGKINLGDREVLPVISPVGYPGDRKSMLERAFRFVAASDKRKPWQELYYLHDMETPLTKENAGRFDTPLECVRIAPSASNKQPWRIIKGRGQDAFHFYLKRTRGYEKMVKDISLQNVDMGIAMCHFELSAREFGLNGDWQVKDPQIKTGDLEYIASWK